MRQTRINQFVFGLSQVVSPVLQTAARRWSATVRTSGPQPFPSSPLPSTTSLQLKPPSPSPWRPCSQATSQACRPAPAWAQGLGLGLEVQSGRTATTQLRKCTASRVLSSQRLLLLDWLGPRLLGATPRSASREHPAPGPAPPAPPALSQRTASPARFQPASAPCRPRPR